jgi:hypothetical protein
VCQDFCAATQPNSPQCQNTCLSGGRKLMGQATLGHSDLQALDAAAGESGTVEIAAELVLGRLSEPVVQVGGADLRVDAEAAADSVYIRTETFASDSCAVYEGCVSGTGPRRLLKFDGVIQNLGDQDFVLGNPDEFPDRFTYSACHGHYHLNEAMAYELLDPITRLPVYVGAQRVVGHKQGFCMLDMRLVAGNLEPYYTCSYQGLTSGWADVYSSSLDCQWVDVTGVPSGEYLLRITVNPGGSLPEADLTNNSAEISVQL